MFFGGFFAREQMSVKLVALHPRRQKYEQAGGRTGNVQGKKGGRWRSGQQRCYGDGGGMVIRRGRKEKGAESGGVESG